MKRLEQIYGAHFPSKYFEGLTPRQTQIRFRELVLRRHAPQKNFEPFVTDFGKHTQTSNYTRLFYQTWGENNTSLESKSRVTGVPLSIITQVYNKGLAAWANGHRPGATQQQWGYARVHSFLTLGRTAWTADFLLLQEALLQMKPKDRRNFLLQPMLQKK